MEFRRLVLIWSLGAVAASAATVRQVPLDDRLCHEVRIGIDAPTTIVFPAPIVALDGANVSAKPDEAPVVLSHQPGTAYFAVRASRPGAHGALNVMLRGKAYALSFKATETPDRTVTFVERTEAAVPAARSEAISGLSLLDRARHAAELEGQAPVLAAQMERLACPTSDKPIRLLQAFRFAAEQAMVLQWRVENRGEASLVYPPAMLQVLHEQRAVACVLTDAGGTIPPRSAETFWVVVRDTDIGNWQAGALTLGGIQAR